MGEKSQILFRIILAILLILFFRFSTYDDHSLQAMEHANHLQEELRLEREYQEALRRCNAYDLD